MKSELRCPWCGSTSHESMEAGDSCVGFLRRRIEAKKRQRGTKLARALDRIAGLEQLLKERG